MSYSLAHFCSHFNWRVSIPYIRRYVVFCNGWVRHVSGCSHFPSIPKVSIFHLTIARFKKCDFFSYPDKTQIFFLGFIASCACATASMADWPTAYNFNPLNYYVGSACVGDFYIAVIIRDITHGIKVPVFGNPRIFRHKIEKEEPKRYIVSNVVS